MSGPRGQDTSLVDGTAEAHPTLDRAETGLPGAARRRRETKRVSGYVARDVIQSESKTLERTKAQEGIGFEERLTTGLEERIHYWSNTL
jgi:hypothetical protein